MEFAAPLTFSRPDHMRRTRVNRGSGRRAAHTICALLILAGVAPGTMRGQAHASTLRGITFSIDSGPSSPALAEAVKRVGASPVLVTQLAGTIVFAGGRGRLDVSAVARHPVVRTQGIVLAAPLAMPGDYYLFDSTGFVLVRPATRTFSSFQIADDRYNFEGRRAGWPAFFPFKRTSVDTLGPDAPAATLRQHGAYPVYWHADTPDRQLARGYFIVVDAQPGELAAVRWFAAARALAELMRRGDNPGGASPTLTALGLWAEAHDTLPPTPITEMRSIRALRKVDVRAERLLLPGGYVERPWSGYEHVQQVFPTSADGGVYWQRLPRQ